MTADDVVARAQAVVRWDMFPGDHMVTTDIEHYRSVGASALRAIAASHLLANKPDPESILDFAAATGRVTRWLRAAFAAADLDVADITEDWVAWNAATFGATAWLSSEDLAAVEAPRRYDLIWCGSLATHFSADATRLLMKKFFKWLNPGGICVMTTHGRQTISYMLNRVHDYFPGIGGEYNQAAVHDVLAQLGAKGYGYVAHPGQSWGVSVNTLEWIVRAVAELDARLLTVSEHAWDNHQDVVAFQRPA